MLAIRLQRVGRTKQPLYRLVVSEKSKDTYGNHLEILGQYNPHKKEAVLKEDRIKHWLNKGAQASPSVNNLLINKGLIKGDKQKAVRITKKRAAKKETKAAEAKVSEVPAEEKTNEVPVDKPAETKVEEKNEESSAEEKK